LKIILCAADDGPSCNLKSDGRDPVEYCTHIQSQIKQTQHRLAQEKVMSKLSQKQQEEEREIQRRQLEDIFRLMEEHKEKFGVSDVGDVKEQLKLYVQ
jgi:DNA topoisomerase VI subunit B